MKGGESDTGGYLGSHTPTIGPDAHAGIWPHSGDVIARDFKGGPEDVKAEMIGENAAKLDGLVA